MKNVRFNEKVVLALGLGLGAAMFTFVFLEQPAVATFAAIATALIIRCTEGITEGK